MTKERTALKRSTTSAPARALVDLGLIRQPALDYGSGYGKDAEMLGMDAYDPFHGPYSIPNQQYNTILMTYVLNTLRRRQQQEALARAMQHLQTQGKLYATVRTDKKQLKGPTSRGTYQTEVNLPHPVVSKGSGFKTYEVPKEKQAALDPTLVSLFHDPHTLKNVTRDWLKATYHTSGLPETAVAKYLARQGRNLKRGVLTSGPVKSYLRTPGGVGALEGVRAQLQGRAPDIEGAIDRFHASRHYEPWRAKQGSESKYPQESKYNCFFHAGREILDNGGKLMKGPPMSKGETAHFWVERNNKIIDKTSKMRKIDYPHYSKGNEVSLQKNIKHLKHDPLFKTADLKPDVTLQPHQQRIKERLDAENALLLYHGLGSGKTLSSLAATEGQPTTMVVPAALRPHYAKEIGKFTTGATPRSVLSYEAATKQLPPGDALVLDEIQRIGRHETARARKMLEHAGEYKKRLALTGTPLRNYPHELAPILSFLHPDKKIPLDAKTFDKYFLEERKIPRTFYQWFKGLPPGIEQRPKNTEVLQRLFEGHVDYHKPAEKDYPGVTRKIKHVTMSPEQSNFYKTITQKANPILAAKVMEDMPLSKQELRGLQSFMTGARMVSNTTAPFGGTGHSPKFNQAAIDFLSAAKKNPRHKAVTYSNYLAGGVNEYKKIMDQYKVPSAVFHGGLSDKDKKAIVEDFNSGKLRNLLLTGAGSEGLDLKGTRAIQILEPHWNEARLKQVEGRGIRFKSHAHLPEKERHVEVIRYHSQVPRTFWQKLRGVPEDIGADPYLHNLAKKKDHLNQQFLDILRREGIRATKEYEAKHNTSSNAK